MKVNTADRRRRIAGAGLFVALSGMAALHAGQAQVASKTGMTWMVFDLPPGTMPVNGKLTDGISDIVSKMVFQEMPEFSHQVTVVSAARAMATLSEGKPMCIATALMTPERERIAYFAVTHMLPPLQVVVRAEVAAKLPMNAKGEVVPDLLVNSSGLRGLVVAQRSYAPALDAVLANRRPGSTVSDTLSAGAGDGGKVFTMLMHDRGDFTFDYDFALAYQQSRHPELPMKTGLKAFPLAGMAPIKVGFACPHTPWGRATVIRIDAIVARLANRPEYRASAVRWMTADGVKRYQPLLNDFTKQRMHPTSPSQYPVIGRKGTQP
jgi:uncharacterized protein (TIGR02285 family)